MSGGGERDGRQAGSRPGDRRQREDWAGDDAAAGLRAGDRGRHAFAKAKAVIDAATAAKFEARVQPVVLDVP